jgi:hypothetical protein
MLVPPSFQRSPWILIWEAYRKKPTYRYLFRPEDHGRVRKSDVHVILKANMRSALAPPKAATRAQGNLQIFNGKAGSALKARQSFGLLSDPQKSLSSPAFQ